MQAQTDRLQKRYDFGSWSVPRGPSTLAWGFRLSGSELPGWKTHRIQNVDLPGQPPAVLSVWRPARGNGALLALNVYECDDETAARSYLLRMLGEFQGPGLQQVATPGEVAFAAGNAGLLFARGNLVALVRSIERTQAPVAESADRLDSILSGDAPDAGTGPAFEALTADPISDSSFAIDLTASDPADGHVWFQLRSSTGRLGLLNHRPIFFPAGDGPHEIRVSAIGPSGVSVDTLRLEGGPQTG